MDQAGPARLPALDLIRGVAVLGILAVNIAGFAGPTGATLSPHIPESGTTADEIAYAVVFVLFEGKMRALFSLLFGAGMALFIERAEAQGCNGDLLQLRRLGWLMLFGLLHYFLFWWGDILFPYAVCGIVALLLRGLPPRNLVVGALIAFAGWHAIGTIETLPGVRAEEAVRQGTASAEQASADQDHRQWVRQSAREDLQQYRSGFGEQVRIKLREGPFYPLEITSSLLGETLPLILLGMAMQRMNFFAAAIERRRWPLLALGFGTLWTLAILAWVWARQFPPQAMSAAMLYWAAPAHLAMAIGYAGLLASAAPRIGGTAVGRWITRAGRMAFSNYLGTTVLMTAIFYGWGLGLLGRFGEAELLAFVVIGWAAMLLVSTAWLSRFRQGPLEWLWRSLTERRRLPLVR